MKVLQVGDASSHLRFSSGQGPGHWWGEENDGLLPHLVAVIRLEFITKRWIQPRIRVSVQGTVRTQDPNPSKSMEGSIRATPLYEIVVLTLSHYLISQHWVCPSPPTSVSCQVRPFIFFGEMANHLGWGAPKHTPVSTYRYTLVSRRIVVLLSGSHGNGTSPPYPSTHAHTIQGIRVQAPPQVLWF